MLALLAGSGVRNITGALIVAGVIAGQGAPDGGDRGHHHSGRDQLSGGEGPAAWSALIVNVPSSCQDLDAAHPAEAARLLESHMQELEGLQFASPLERSDIHRVEAARGCQLGHELPGRGTPG